MQIHHVNSKVTVGH